MKGQNPASFKKHDVIKRLAWGQLMYALKGRFMRAGNRAAIVDMHAGDGFGVEGDQADFFYGPESKATPRLAIELAAHVRKQAIACDTFLCEKSPESRQRLATLADGCGAILLRNHDKLPDMDSYDWMLVLNDPNGPADHGDEILQRISRQVRRADFIVVVNEIACDRILGVKTPSANPRALKWNRDEEGIAKRHADTAWRLDATEWAKRLNRRCALRNKYTYGNGAMQGRIILVTNYPQTTPRGFDLIAANGGAGRSPGTPPQSPSIAA